MEKLGSFISSRPRATVIIIVIITLVMGAMAAILEYETGWDAWMPDTPEIQAIDEIDQDFGNIEYAEVLVKSKEDDVLTKTHMLEILNLIKMLHEDEETGTMLSENKNTISIAGIIADYELISTNPAPTVDDQITQIAQMDDAGIQASLLSLIENPTIPQQYKDEVLITLSKEYKETGKAKATGVFLFIDRAHGIDEARDTEVRIEELVEEFELSSHSEMSVYGDLLVDYYAEAIINQFGIVLVVGLIGVVLIGYLTFRRFSDIVLTGLGLLFAVMWSMGFAYIMGWKLDAMSMMIPILLLGLGIDYSIHTLMHYREKYQNGKDLKKAMFLAIAAVSVPLFLATITTVIGFLSNVSSDYRAVQHFGIIAAVGIISCFVVMNTFVPAARLLLDQRTIKKDKPLKFANTADTTKDNGRLLKIGERLLGMPTAVICVALILAALGGWGATKLETNYTEIGDIPRNSETKEAFHYIAEEFDIQATEAMNVLVKGDISDPTLISSIYNSIENMRDDQYIQKRDNMPAVDWILPAMNTYANSELDPLFTETYLQYDTNNDGVIDSPSRENFIILIEQMYNNNEDTEFLIHRNDGGQYDKLVLRIATKTDNFKYSHEVIQELEEDIAPIREIADEVTVTGLATIFDLQNINIKNSSIFSTVYCAIAALIVLTITFFIRIRSILLGLITTIPVVLVVLWTYGTLKVFGFPLNFEVALIGALTIALGIDYSIHISHRIYSEMKEGNDFITSYRNTIKHTGRNLFFSASTTSFVFLAMILLNTEGTLHFGIAGAIMIIYSYIAAVVVLPVILSLRIRFLSRGA